MAIMALYIIFYAHIYMYHLYLVQFCNSILRFAKSFMSSCVTSVKYFLTTCVHCLLISFNIPLHLSYKVVPGTIMIIMIMYFYYNNRYGVDITLPCIECIESLSNSSPSANVDVYIQAMKLFLRVSLQC